MIADIADLDGTIADLEADEGVILHAYQDHLGYWTIGTGRLIDRRKGGGISLAENDYLLTNDIAGRVTILLAQYPWFATLDPIRQSAFVNLAFNLGVDGLAKFKQTLAAASRGDWTGVARGLKNSLWYRQVQRSRSDRIIRMMTKGHR